MRLFGTRTSGSIVFAFVHNYFESKFELSEFRKKCPENVSENWVYQIQTETHRFGPYSKPFHDYKSGVN